jgi:transcriptional regulator with XRE-family HTH domain
MSFGERLKFYRRENNMSQETLAIALNVTPQAVSKWENNLSEPEFLIIQKLTELFRVSYDHLFSSDRSAVDRMSPLPIKKHPTIGMIYLGWTVFFAFLSASLIFVAVLTLATPGLPWYFPVAFSIGAGVVLAFLWSFGQRRLSYLNAPHRLIEVYQDRIELVADGTVLPLDQVSQLKITTYKIANDTGSIVISGGLTAKVIARDVYPLAEARTLLYELIFKIKTHV